MQWSTQQGRTLGTECIFLDARFQMWTCSQQFDMWIFKKMKTIRRKEHTTTTREEDRPTRSANLRQRITPDR